jgi:glycosyltransferase involved in cell wall biosynthesis
MKKRIALIGPYPPPIGGVSVHIQRLARVLQECGLDYIIFDEANEKKIVKDLNYQPISNFKLWLLKYLFWCKDKVIHYHSRNWYVIFLLSITAIIHHSKLIVTLHSFREEPNNFNVFQKLFFRYAIKMVHHFIAVGENEKNKLIQYNCDPKKISVIPAFIVPKYQEEDDKLIPSSIWDFMKNNDINIVANAFQISFYKGQDLYGIDMCIDLCIKLKKNFCNNRIGFVFCLPEIGDIDYFNKIKNHIKTNKIEDRFIFVNEKIPLYPILSKADIFVRPTNTDGDAISIREALYYKIPTIASDVVERPKGTIIFANRNYQNFYNQVSNVINKYNMYRDKLSNLEMADSTDKIVKIYLDLIV